MPRPVLVNPNSWRDSSGADLVMSLAPGLDTWEGGLALLDDEAHPTVVAVATHASAMERCLSEHIEIPLHMSERESDVEGQNSEWATSG
jgi:hypothetical protein